jgi:hypothetical protein
MSTENKKKSHAQRERGETLLTNPATRGPFMEIESTLAKPHPRYIKALSILIG